MIKRFLTRYWVAIWFTLTVLCGLCLAFFTNISHKIGSNVSGAELKAFPGAASLAACGGIIAILIAKILLDKEEKVTNKMLEGKL